MTSFGTFPPKSRGTLRGVGVGPGDPQLMTFKAAEILRRSAVIAYVVDEKGDSFAAQAAAAHFPASARELPLRFSMSPQREQRLAARREAARQVEAFLSAGQDVTFIVEGDPLLYSTFQHILAALPPGTPVEICPGVSALTASAAEAVFPLALENESMLVAAASPAALQQLPGWLEQFEVLVLFKVHRHLEALRAVLKTHEHGRAALVQRASLDGQAQVTELAEWDGTPLPYFSMLLIRASGDGRGQP